ncbi:CPBP family glutamic-type intramembrane protease [Lactobacillus hamsteri]|nr:CPBP family glutamic-type intramembrane protease [Lactobacillus hamsteri]
MAREWNEVLWNWDLSLINPLQSAVFTNKWQVYFTAAEAGVLEETARYVFILTLLVMFKNKHWQLEFTILGSSLIFALFHLSNIFSKGRTIEDVAYQILYAFGIGCLLGTLYLLTGKLWLSMLIHAGADFLAFSQTPLALAGASAFADCSNPRFIISFILLIVSFSVSVIFWFSCRNIIKRNAEKIMVSNY